MSTETEAVEVGVTVPASVNGVPAALLELHAPLTNTEMRVMYDRIADIHAMLTELREVKDRFPEILDSMPPPFKMMLKGFVG